MEIVSKAQHFAKKFLFTFLMVCSWIVGNAQAPLTNMLHCSRGYYGGFEAGSSNISIVGAGTDYQYCLPCSGGINIIQNALEVKGIDALNKQPRSGKYFLLSHNRAAGKINIWWKKLTVKGGETYYFRAWSTLVSKSTTHPVKIQLRINDSIIAVNEVSGKWDYIQGKFVAPPNAGTIKISIDGSLTDEGNYIGIDDIYFGKRSWESIAATINNSIKDKKNTTSVTTNESGLKAVKLVTAKRALIKSQVAPQKSKKPVISIYPNPAREYFVININSFVFGKAVVNIINQTGKVVLTRDTHVSVGLNAITIDNRSVLGGGNYKVQVKSGRDVCDHELVVL